jgi:hypothetical protein
VQRVERFRGEDELTLETELDSGTRLHRVGRGRRKRSTEARCVDFIAPLQVIDGRPRYEIEPPLVAGRRTLSLNVGAQSVDPLAIETERLGVRWCDSFELDWPEGWEREPFWYTELRIAFTGFVPHFSIGGLRLLASRWTERSRFGAEVGLVNAVVCEDEDEECPSRFALPLAIDTTWFANPLNDGRELFFGAGGRALAVLAQAAPGDGLSLHGVSPQLTAQVLVGSVATTQIDRGPAGVTAGIEGHVGPALLYDQGGVSAGVALGLSLTYGWAE